MKSGCLTNANEQSLIKWVNTALIEAREKGYASYHYDYIFGKQFDSDLLFEQHLSILRSLIVIMGDEIVRFQPMLSITLEESRYLKYSKFNWVTLMKDRRNDEPPSIYILNLRNPHLHSLYEEYKAPLTNEYFDALDGYIAVYYICQRSAEAISNCWSYSRSICFEYHHRDVIINIATR